MSDAATTWARDMGRHLNLKPATRLVLLNLANEHGTRSTGFFTFHGYLAADCGMSISALKSHLTLLRKARLVIAGDPQLTAGFPANARPNVYKLNVDIDPDTAKALYEAVDNPENLGGQNLGGQNQTPQTPEISGSTDRQILTPQTPESRESGGQNPATNPFKGGGGTFQPSRAFRGKPKSNGTSPKDDGKRLCLECMTKHPMDGMIQREDGRWICERHAA